jgi:hypothetical protein
MTRRGRAGVMAALGVAWIVSTSAALADGPTKDECINANDVAQTARQEGKLRETKKQLLVCVSKSCPGPVRDDCTERLDEVDKAMPTVVFAASDARGNDLSDVRVSVDGEALAESLDGTPVAVDPGGHVFRFEASNGGIATKKIVLREAEKGRRVSIVFGTNTGATDASKDHPSGGADKGANVPPSQWPVYVAFAGAGVGLVAGVVFTALTLKQQSSLDAAAARDTFCMTSSSCSPTKAMSATADDTSASATYNSDYVLAIVGYGVAAIGAGIGTYLLLKASGGEADDRTKGTSGVTVAPWVGFGSGGIGGKF